MKVGILVFVFTFALISLCYSVNNVRDSINKSILVASSVCSYENTIVLLKIRTYPTRSNETCAGPGLCSDIRSVVFALFASVDDDPKEKTEYLKWVGTIAQDYGVRPLPKLSGAITCGDKPNVSTVILSNVQGSFVSFNIFEIPLEKTLSPTVLADVLQNPTESKTVPSIGTRIDFQSKLPGACSPGNVFILEDVSSFVIQVRGDSSCDSVYYRYDRRDTSWHTVSLLEVGK